MDNFLEKLGIKTRESVMFINPLTMDRGRIDPVVPGFRSTPFSRTCFMHNRYYLNKQIQLELRTILMFCDRVAIEIFRVTASAERSEEALQ